MSPTGHNSYTGQNYDMNPTQFGSQQDADRYLQMLSSQLGSGATVADAQFSAGGPFSLNQPYRHLRPAGTPYGGLNVGMLRDLEDKYGTAPGSQFQQVVGNDMAYLGKDDPSMRPDPVADPNNSDVAAYWGRGEPVTGNFRGTNIEAGGPTGSGDTSMGLYTPRPLAGATPPPPAGLSQDQQNAMSSGAERRRRLAAGLSPYASDPNYQIPTGPPPGASGFPGGRDPLSPLPIASNQARQNAAPGSAVQGGIPSRNASMYPGRRTSMGGFGGGGRTVPRYGEQRTPMAGLHQANPRPTPRPRYSSF